MQYDYFDYTTKRDYKVKGVHLGYFIDSKDLVSRLAKPTNNWKFVDKIFVISLESRDDRRKILHKNLIKIGIKKVTYFIPMRFTEVSIEDKRSLNGVFYENLKDEVQNPTVMACYISHLICYREAYRLKVKNLLLLEDDCKFKSIPPDIFKQIKGFVKKEQYDALYLHNSHKFLTPASVKKLMQKNILQTFDYSRFETQSKYKNIKIFAGCGLAHCILFSDRYLTALRKLKVQILKRNISRNIDFILHCQARTYNFWTTYPQFTSQFESLSDITNRVVRKGF